MHLDSVVRFFSEFEHLVLALETKREKDVQRLFDDLQPLYAEVQIRRKLLADRFNVFEAIDMERRELTHSAFLAFLLRPSSRHDQGATILEAFLRHVEIPVGPRRDLDSARVATEYALGELGRLDVVIFLGDGRVVAIENKVDAGEQDAQIARYQRWLARQHRPRLGWHELIFLTPSGRRPMHEDPLVEIRVRCISYFDISRWLHSMSDLPPRLGAVMNMYGDLCRRIGEQQWTK